MGRNAEAAVLLGGPTVWMEVNIFRNAGARKQNHTKNYKPGSMAVIRVALAVVHVLASVSAD